MEEKVENNTEVRPWGYFEILFQSNERTIKKLVVKPNQRISLQRHSLRDEFWFIENGKAIVTLGENEQVLIRGNYIMIPKGTLHRIWNFNREEDLVLIEIAYGVFKEDDIIRYQDDYNRGINDGL